MEFRGSIHDDGQLGTSASPPPIRASAFTKPPSSSSSHNGLVLSPPTPAAANPDSCPGTASFSRHPSAKTTSGDRAANYKECLKNHAASIGGHVLDGCGEFMPLDDDAFKCAACGCHRSFHRKSFDAAGGRRSASSTTSALLPLLLPPPPLHSYRHHQKHFGFQPSLSGGTTTDSSSEDQLDAADAAATAAQPTHMVSAASRKRFRTTFTAEQKEKMLGFAERVGWRLQKQYDNVIEEFCNEIGVRRKVFKVWMHNNKHSLRKQQLLLQHQPHEQLEHLHLQQREQP
ncbi:ZF-HD homeobox protein [Platanthera zijinensis]|uniref:ZF-HD homeobox protein n=1 Tax=Platanthera zijinensis TaxID=2320716 RepID=A0AAP0G4H6_9ASPA